MMMRSLNLFIALWCVLALLALQEGETAVGLFSVILMNANLILLRLEELETHIPSLVKHAIVRDKADGYYNEATS